ncbi:MAG: hypothetical protein KZQ97_22310, partial [Candidatus Thiodiazotropha sp. (ex Dulcina madagascariensis)]|nr:hypothetical protein [Candidatus Thiodiazotropha sp. (ex Dulcina madagascariensis)]
MRQRIINQQIIVFLVGWQSWFNVHLYWWRRRYTWIYEGDALQRLHGWCEKSNLATQSQYKRVYADSCGLILAFLGSGGRNAATIFSLRYS